MNLVHIETLFTIKEMTTDGHAPVLFHCSDTNNYYCKYRINVMRDEINCLAFEVIAYQLLRNLEIPTPKVALVKISEGTLNKKIIKKNKRMREQMVVFGSKEIKPSSVLNDFAICKDKRDFNRILNPRDLIKIAIFDLWVDNADRGRPFNSGYNYNLLQTAENQKEKIVAFDHAFIFGGANAIGGFISGAPVDTRNKLHLTPYYKSVVKYFSDKELTDITDNFISLLHHDYREIISQTVDQIADHWDLMPKLAKRSSAFLMTEKRLEEIESIIKSSKS